MYRNFYLYKNVVFYLKKINLFKKKRGEPLVTLK